MYCQNSLSTVALPFDEKIKSEPSLGHTSYLKIQ